MMKALLVPVLATGLALGGAAKPAKAASAEEIAALIVGLAVIGAIASSGNQSRAEEPETNVGRYNNDWRYYDNNRRHNRRVLPAQCVRRFETNRGVRNLAIERCLDRNGVNVDRLPDRCEIRVRTNRGVRDAYRKVCLEREGYRFKDTVARNDGRRVLDARRNRDD